VIVGVGIDVVDVGRLARALTRTPRLCDRLFTPGELLSPRPESRGGRGRPHEARAHPRGGPAVVSAPSGRPSLRLHGGVAQEAQAQGIGRWHLSLSHDAGIATAVVVAES